MPRYALALVFGLLAWGQPQIASAQSSAPSVTQFTTVNTGDISAELLYSIFGKAFTDITGYTPSSLTVNQDPAGLGNSTPDGGLLGTLSVVLNAACMVLVVIVITWGMMTANLSAAYEGVQAARRYNTLWVPLRSVASFGFLAPYDGGYSLIQAVVLKAALLSIGIANAGFSALVAYVSSGAPVSMPDIPGSYALASNLLRSEVCMAALNMPAPGYGGSMNFVQISPSAGGGVTSTNTAPNPLWINAAAGATGLAPLAQLASTGMAYFSPTNTRDTWSMTYERSPGISDIPQTPCGNYEMSLEHLLSGDGGVGAAQAALFSARVSAIQNLRTSMATIAADIVQASPPDPAQAPVTATDVNNGTINSSTFSNDRSTWNTALDTYNQAIFTAAQAAVNSMNSAKGTSPGGSNGPFAGMAQSGWIMAGGLYWDMLSTNRQIQDAIGESAPGDGPRNESLLANGTLPGYAATTYANATANLEGFMNTVQYNAINDPSVARGVGLNTPNMTGMANAFNSNSGAGGYTKLKALFNLLFSSGTTANGKSQNFGPAEYFIQRLTYGGDFVANMQSAGGSMFTVGITLFALASFAGSHVGQAAGQWGSILLGFMGGGGGGPAGALAGYIAGDLLMNLAKDIGSLIVMVSIPLIMIGIVLGYYLPFIPMLMWMINVTGWMISVVKSVFAAPVWAAAHAIPEGEGWAGTSARQGYFLIFSLILRPFLLLSGMMASMLMINAAGHLFAILYPTMMRSASHDSSVGLFSNMLFIAMAGGLLVVIAHKCFALGHEMADEILKWIGSAGESLGDAQHHEGIRAFVTGSMAGGAARAAGSMMNLGKSDPGSAAAARQQRSLAYALRKKGGGALGGAANDLHMP